MSLFTTPLTLTDSNTDDHIFTFRSQRPDNRSIVGDYIEDAADVEAESLITVKHDIRSQTPRSVVQRTVKKHPASITENTTLYPITINLSCVANKAFTPAELQIEFDILLAAAAEAGFVQGIRSKKI